MKILYSYHGLQQKVGGVSRYFYELVKRISKRHTVDICMVFISNQYFEEILKLPKFIFFKYGMVFIRTFLEEMHLFLKVKTSKYDLIHLTGDCPKVFSWTKKPIVITIHDMIPEIYYVKRKQIIANRAESIHRASAIICVSNNTKNDLLKIFPNIDSNKIYVVYHGLTPIPLNYKLIVDGEYILFVGSRDSEYKNFLFFIEAISFLLIERNLKLICTGSSFTVREISKIKELGITELVLCYGFVSEYDLACLYHYAQCFVYPSVYEGFGIPILEAFSHGCPTCISNTSCFPEIGGNAVAYFEPKNINSIQYCISNVIDNAIYRKELVSKGRLRLKEFTWDKTTQETLRIYELVNKIKSS